MLERVHYIVRFIITMKHSIYGAILCAARGLGQRCKLLQRKSNLMDFSLKVDTVRSFRRRRFYRSDDPTNSVKALKEGGQLSSKTQSK